jgi:hypothetical protein
MCIDVSLLFFVKKSKARVFLDSASSAIFLYLEYSIYFITQVATPVSTKQIYKLSL